MPVTLTVAADECMCVQKLHCNHYLNTFDKAMIVAVIAGDLQLSIVAGDNVCNGSGCFCTFFFLHWQFLLLDIVVVAVVIFLVFAFITLVVVVFIISICLLLLFQLYILLLLLLFLPSLLTHTAIFLLYFIIVAFW